MLPTRCTHWFLPQNVTMRASASTARLVVMAAVLTALPGAAQGCRADGTCAGETFCASFYATCDGNGGRFDSTAECVAVYNSLAAGDAGATSGASQACLECESVLYPSSVPPMTRYPP